MCSQFRVGRVVSASAAADRTERAAAIAVIGGPAEVLERISTSVAIAARPTAAGLAALRAAVTHTAQYGSWNRCRRSSSDFRQTPEYSTVADSHVSTRCPACNANFTQSAGRVRKTDRRGPIAAENSSAEPKRNECDMLGK
jgi:hypothetical protein